MNRRHGEWCLLAFAPLLILLVAVGCRQSGGKYPTHPVTGRVAFQDGTPLAIARVAFYSPEKRVTAEGFTDDKGVYRLSTYGKGDGAVLGAQRVSVTPQGLAIALGPDGEALPGAKPPKPIIHLRYQSYETSKLSYTVVEGKNTFDITVEKP